MASQAPTYAEQLFSYGTLQLAQVQLATFARRLDGDADEISGYTLSMLKIDDPAVVATSGQTHHRVVNYTGQPSDKVTGTVFSISAAELQHADAYEVAAYRRDRVKLTSGRIAWVCVAAQSPHPTACE